MAAGPGQVQRRVVLPIDTGVGDTKGERSLRPPRRSPHPRRVLLWLLCTAVEMNRRGNLVRRIQGVTGHGFTAGSPQAAEAKCL